MRIIAGKYRSRKVSTLKGLSTRPTLDQVKKRIFNSLGGYLVDMNILTSLVVVVLYRVKQLVEGARRSTILGSTLQQLRGIKKNAEVVLGVEEQLTIIHGTYNSILKKLIKEKYDIVFLDPPFRMKVIDELCIFLMENDMIAIGGYIVCEYPKEDIVQKDYDGYRIKLCRRYASSEILILEREN